MDKRIDQDYSDFEAGIIEELEVRLAEQKDLMDRAMIAWEESGRPFLMPEEVQSWWMKRPLFSPTLEKASNKNLGGFMEVKEERIADIIRKVDGNHNMGAGALSDATMQELENDRPLSDLEIVQKALEKSNLVMTVDKEGIYLHTDNFYSCEFHCENSKSLLVWAKQTIGME